jgi:hypothetical protein
MVGKFRSRTHRDSPGLTGTSPNSVVEMPHDQSEEVR